MKKKIKLILVLLLIVFAVYNITTLFKGQESTYITQIDTVEITQKFDAVVCMEEKLVTFKPSSKNGSLDLCVAEGEMVKKGKLIALYYDSEIDESKKKLLSEINKKIQQINSSPTDVGALSEDPDKLEKQIGQKMAEVIDVAHTRDMNRISSLKDDINLLVSRKLTAEGNTQTATEVLQSLRAEKAQIEKEYGGKKEEITSPHHGIFSTNLDGYETSLTPEKALNMTVSDFDAVKRGEAKKDAPNAVCKLTDNTSFWLCAKIKETDAKEYKIGSYLKLRLTSGKNIRAKVEAVSLAQGGECILTFSSQDSGDELIGERVISLECVKESYTGYRIPLEAIRVQDEKTYVYVRTENNIKRRDVEIIYKDDDVTIAKADNLAPNALLLYDEIVLGEIKQ